MADNYFQKAKETANNFIQNIVFIDDEANNSPADNGVHRLNSLAITKSFAKSQKICAVYNPEEEKDLEDLINICKKADVVVLDWKIDLPQPTVVGKEEDDAEVDDSRGKYTVQIIENILSDEDIGKDSLKLIIVYTGETDLRGITKTIFESLKSLEGIKQNDFSVLSYNFRILVYGKPTINAKHTGEIQNRIVDWDQLPELILEQFTLMTYGLLSTVVLKSLVAIRKKAFRLLKSFSSTTDPAFLGHKALLPNPEDAEEQLIDIIGSEIKSILKSYNPGFYISNELINQFIEETIEDKEYPFGVKDKENFQSIPIPDQVNRTLLCKFVEVGIENIYIKHNTPFTESIPFSSQCHQIITNFYSPSPELAQESNKQFALLTSVKTNYNTQVAPLLSLGSVVRKKDDTYWLCIQPKCDAIRITKTRQFIFLPLTKVENSEQKFDFLINYYGEEFLLKINYTIYQSQFISFKANKNKEVRGEVSDGKIWFEGNPSLEWLGELKNDFSQSIANNFATGLSRVAMDHSEWLRRGS